MKGGEVVSVRHRLRRAQLGARETRSRASEASESLGVGLGSAGEQVAEFPPADPGDSCDFDPWERRERWSGQGIPVASCRVRVVGVGVGSIEQPVLFDPVCLLANLLNANSVHMARAELANGRGSAGFPVGSEAFCFWVEEVFAGDLGVASDAHNATAAHDGRDSACGAVRVVPVGIAAPFPVGGVGFVGCDELEAGWVFADRVAVWGDEGCVEEAERPDLLPVSALGLSLLR